MDENLDYIQHSSLLSSCRMYLVLGFEMKYKGASQRSTPAYFYNILTQLTKYSSIGNDLKMRVFVLYKAPLNLCSV